MGMITINPLFLLTKLSKNTRIFVAGSIIACYGLFLYELLPEYLFIPTSATIYFGLPAGAIVIVLAVLPSLLSRNSQKTPEINVGLSEQMSQPQIETISLEQTKEQGIILPDNNASSAIQSTIQAQMPENNEAANPVITQAPAVSEAEIQNMVSRAMEPIQKENIRMQDTISDLKNEIGAIKSSMDSLADTVESSLTDLKSFQAELANPLNFMRKYFDSIDIKSLSDPTLPLHMEQLPISDVTQKKDTYENENNHVKNEIPDNTKGKENTSEQMIKNQYEVLKNDCQILPFKQILDGKLTLGKLMTTISLMEEILQTLGRDSIDVLIEQCKMMGLGQEDEHIIYNVINMMDKSGLSVNDTLIMLYKFGKVMGMNDRESDLIYAKLLMNQGKNHDNVMTVEKKAG